MLTTIIGIGHLSDVLPIYLLLHKPIQSLAALIVALFGPKIYADFIQPKAQEPRQSPLALS